MWMDGGCCVLVVQDAGSPNLRVGLTPHIKALRSSLASHDEDEGDTAGAPPTGLLRPLPPSSGQQGDRRASLAEAPRANLLFEPAADAEVRSIDDPQPALQVRSTCDQVRLPEL